MSVKTIQLPGVWVSCLTYDSALDEVKRLASQPKPTAVCPANTHSLAEAQRDPQFAEIMRHFDLIMPDGMPVVWAMNWFGGKLKDRVYGPYFTAAHPPTYPSAMASFLLWRQPGMRR